MDGLKRNHNDPGTAFESKNVNVARKDRQTKRCLSFSKEVSVVLNESDTGCICIDNTTDEYIATTDRTDQPTTQEDGDAEDNYRQKHSQIRMSPSSLTKHTEDVDASGNSEIVRKAQEEGRVEVVLNGTVTQEGCCRFVSEIIKCILYQRQQLPMTYDQLLYCQKKQQAAVQNKEVVGWRPAKSESMDWRKCQRTLQELEEVLQQLEVLFSLSLVPRVLLLLGGSLVLPKELYEINMEALMSAAADNSLRVSSCLKQIFRTLFVADLLSDVRPVRLMSTTILVLAHRDCGVSWFRPKLNFKLPSRVKNQIIALSSDPGSYSSSQAELTNPQDYVWFQAPNAIKGFSK